VNFQLKKPCFVSRSDNASKKKIKCGEVTQLHNGDRFGLLYSSHWYEVLQRGIEDTPIDIIDNEINKISKPTNPAETEVIQNTLTTIAIKTERPESPSVVCE
jgi:hypothetical protein